MDQKNDRKRDSDDLDLEMERDTEIRRDTQVRGSLGVPPSGAGNRDADEAVPEFERGNDLDRGQDERESDR